MTAIGPIRVTRRHGRCPACGHVGFGADGVLGVDGWLTAQARRMACAAGRHDPFRKAEARLAELAGWSVDAAPVRRHTHAEAARAAAARADRAGLPAAFAAAAEAGDAAWHIDAGTVNTPDGWRDVKVAVFAVRERGPAAPGADDEPRDLPAPAVRSVDAAVEEVGAFEPRGAAEAARLGVADPTRRSVLGDGAEWIGNMADRSVGGAAQVLDVSHALEHLAAAGRAALGDGPALADGLDSGRRLVAGDGYCGAGEALGPPLPDPAAAERMATAAGPALNYFGGHRDRMGDAVRRQWGQAIGSGLVEGTIKELVNLRLKRTGARCLADRVGAFVELLARSGGVEWDEYWPSLAA